MLCTQILQSHIWSCISTCQLILVLTFYYAIVYPKIIINYFFQLKNVYFHSFTNVDVSYCRVVAIRTTEEERESQLANRVNPLDDELIKTKCLLKAPSARPQRSAKLEEIRVDPRQELLEDIKKSPKARDGTEERPGKEVKDPHGCKDTGLSLSPKDNDVGKCGKENDQVKRSQWLEGDKVKRSPKSKDDQSKSSDRLSNADTTKPSTRSECEHIHRSSRSETPSEQVRRSSRSENPGEQVNRLSRSETPSEKTHRPSRSETPTEQVHRSSRSETPGGDGLKRRLSCEADGGHHEGQTLREMLCDAIISHGEKKERHDTTTSGQSSDKSSSE